MNNRKHNHEQDTVFNQACHYEKSGQFQQAIDYFKKCNSVDSVNTQLRLAACYSKIEDYKASLEYMNAALKICKNNNEHAKVYRELERYYYYMYRRTTNTDYLHEQKKAIDAHPYQLSVEVKNCLANYYFDMNLIDESKSMIKEIRENFSNDQYSMIRIDLLEIAINKRKNEPLTVEQAKKYLRNLKGGKGVNVTTLLEISFVYPSLLDFREIPIIPGNSLEDRLRLAVLNNNVSMFKQADVMFENIIKQHPKYWKARLTYGGVLIERGENDAAIKELRAIINAKAQSDDLDLLIKTYRSLAMAYYEIVDYKKSWACIVAGLKHDPEDASLLSTRAKICDNRDGKANTYYEPSRTADPDRFKKNHPKKDAPEPKVSVEHSNNNSTINTLKKERVSTPMNARPREVIGITKLVNQKQENYPQRQPAVQSNKKSKKPAKKLLPISDYEALYDYSSIYVQDKPSQDVSVLVQREPNSKKTRQQSLQQDKHHSIPDVTLPSVSKKEPDTLPISPANVNTYSCSKFLLFAVGVVVAVTPVVLTAVSLTNTPGNSSG